MCRRMLRYHTDIMFELTKVSEDFIEFLFKLYKKQPDSIFFKQEDTIAKNSRLTSNLINSISDEYKKEIVQNNFKIEDIHHLHLLHYHKKDSELNFHNHIQHEKYSYVIYMDNIGGTLLQIPEGEIFIESERCKLLIFDSKLEHRGITNEEERFVAAGGIIKVYV